MFMEKSKPKGTPGRREQNLMFLVGGLLAGILGTVIVGVLMTRPEPVQIAPTLIPSSTPIPTETLTITFTPTALPPTYTPSPVPAPLQITPLPLIFEPLTTKP